MTENRMTATNGSVEDAASGGRVGAMQAVGEAQEKLRAGAGQVAERLPEAMATAQVAARDTQQALNQMPDQTLVAGAAFSLGLAVGLFFSGVNRMLVLLAVAPAAAMAATLFGRGEQAAEAQPNGSRRRSTPTG